MPNLILLGSSNFFTIFVKLAYEYLNKSLVVCVFVHMTTYSGMLI